MICWQLLKSNYIGITWDLTKKMPFVASRGAETSHISSLAGNLKLLNKTCAFGRLKVNFNFFNQGGV